MSAADVSTDRCLALPARDWSDELMDMLGEANRRAEADLQQLRVMHAKILGCSVEELDERMAKEKTEEDARRAEVRASRPKPAKASKKVASDDPIKIGMASLSDRQRELLNLVRVESNFAVYTGTERIPDWDELKRVMVAIGGTWSRQTKKRAGGFAFADDADAAELVRLALETGEVMDSKAAEFFYTPQDLARLLVERAELSDGMSLIEPSAGTGALIRAAQEAASNLQITAFEALEPHRVELTKLGVVLASELDFVTADPSKFEPAARVVMNPPFSKRQDIQHVRHAYKFLEPGGVLVAIMSSGVKFRDDKTATDFRAFVEANEGEIWDNPDGSFKESGTGVRTVMVRIRRAA